MIICFNGIDGSGKSLQAQRLVEQLNAAGYPAVMVWNGGRSTLTGPFIRLVQRSLRAPKKQQVATSEPAEMSSRYRSYVAKMERIFRRRWLRELWLHGSLLEHTVEIWCTVLPHLLRGRVVVSDRYLYDTVVAVAVLAGLDEAETERLYRVARWYPTPRLGKWLFLDLPAEVAYRRKNDVYDLMFLERRVPLYRALRRVFDIHTIDATATQDEVAAQIWNAVQPILGARRRPALEQDGRP